jgi:hypothetical protein
MKMRGCREWFFTALLIILAIVAVVKYCEYLSECLHYDSIAETPSYCLYVL